MFRTATLLAVLGCLCVALPDVAAAQKYGQIGKNGSVAMPLDPARLTATMPRGNPTAQLLVRIEYPASVSAEAVDSYIRLLRATDRLTNDSSSAQLAQRVVDGINKSTFYAARLYQLLAKEMPADSVVLSPVGLGEPSEPGQVFSSTTKLGQVPAILTIRFVAMRAPQGEVTKKTGTSFLTDDILKIRLNTFGNVITPKAIIVTEAAAWPASAGGVAYLGWPSRENVPFKSCDPRSCIFASADVGDLVPAITLQNMGGAAVGPDQVKNYLPYPFELNLRDFVATCDASLQASITACDHERLLIALVRAALAQTDPYLATRYQWQRFIGRYDPALADRWPGAVDDAPSLERFALVKKLMRAERTLLSQASKRLAAEILDGPAGKAIRNQLADEIAYGQAVAQASRSTLSFASILNVAAGLTNFNNGNLAGQLDVIQAETNRAGQENAIQQTGIAQIDQVYQRRSAQLYDSVRVTMPDMGQGAGQASTTIAEAQVKLIDLYKRAPLPALPVFDPLCRSAPATDMPGTKVDFNGRCDFAQTQDARYLSGTRYLIDQATNVYYGSVERMSDSLQIMVIQSGKCAGSYCNVSLHVTDDDIKRFNVDRSRSVLSTSTYLFYAHDMAVMRQEQPNTGIRDLQVTAEGKIVQASPPQSAAISEAIEKARRRTAALLE